MEYQRFTIATFSGFLILFSIFASVLSSKPPAINTALGDVQGFTQNVFGSNVNTFLGIPFAQPPVGELRFKRPRPVEPWSKPYTASQWPKSCIQVEVSPLKNLENEVYNLGIGDREMSEDCLYLNIWAPEGANGMAVMLWIHGGGFSTGSTNATCYDGRYLAKQEQVVVVSIQYRLGLLGFLYLGTEDAPGNMGLIDQYVAIKWVHDHIAHFGGDPNRITLFGESAGGSSTNLLGLTSLPRYFNNVILQSAPPLMKYSYNSPEETIRFYTTLAKIAKCDSADTFRCFNDMNSSHISELFALLPGFCSTTDGYFLTAPPDELYSKSSGIKVMVGSNENEGKSYLYFYEGVTQEDGTPDPDDLTEADYVKTVEDITKVNDEDTLKELLNVYKGNGDHWDNLDAIVGDMWFSSASCDIADGFAINNDVYLYRLTHRSSACFWHEWVGAGHGCEIDLVFGIHLNSSITDAYTDTDKQVSRAMMKLWANFAKSGNPNRDDVGNTLPDVQWPRYTATERGYLSIDSPLLNVRHNFKAHECRFWRENDIPLAGMDEAYKILEEAEKTEQRDEL